MSTFSKPIDVSTSEPTLVDNVDVSEVDELLQPNPNRFVLFPIQHHDVWKMYKDMQAVYWTAEEIKLHQDIDDWETKLNDDERHYIKHVLAFFAGADGIVNENLIKRFSQEIQIPEVRTVYGFQEMMENIHCVTGDTRILTNQGYVEISALVDKTIDVWNGETFSNVTVRKTGVDQDFIKVKLSNGMELCCTTGHKWLIQGKTDRVLTEKLSIGDVLEEWTYPVIDHAHAASARVMESPFTFGYVFGQGNRHGSTRVLVSLDQKHVISHIDFTMVERYDDVYNVYIPRRYGKNMDFVPYNFDKNTRIEWLSGVIHSIGEFDRDSVTIVCSTNDIAKELQLLISTLGVFATVSCGSVIISAHGIAALSNIGVVMPPAVNVMALPDRSTPDRLSQNIHVVGLSKVAERGDSFCFNEPIRHTGCFAGIVTGQSEVYSQLIDTYVKKDDEKRKLFQSIEQIPCIQRKAEWAQKWIESKEATFGERLIAFSCVEGIHFSSSFAGIFWLKKRGLMPGLSQANLVISRDEGLHTKFAALLFTKYLHKQRPSNERVQEIVREAAEIEKDFVRDAIPIRLIGLNSDTMCQYVEYVSDYLLSELLGVPKIYNSKNPYSWMEVIALNSSTNFFEQREVNYNFSNIDTTFELTEDF
ncbi:Ribonucleotide-diphosphate reductase (RNR), small subunit [Allomyces arbusculus]|nr:Ribonucleotide-diphosphate reductase (RNR), small subunit [Allomyces arbusculus]